MELGTIVTGISLVTKGIDRDECNSDSASAIFSLKKGKTKSIQTRPKLPPLTETVTFHDLRPSHRTPFS